MKHPLMAVGLALALSNAPADASTWYQERSERTDPARGITALVVENARGRVTIRPSADGAIHVRALKLCRAETQARSTQFARETAVEIRSEGDRYRVHVRYPKRVDVRLSFWDLFKEDSWNDGGMLPRVEVRLSLDVPAGMPVRVETVSGDIETARLAGPQTLFVASGDVDVVAAGGPVDVRSVSGDVQCDTLASRLTVQTASGDVLVSLAKSPVRLSTVSGDAVVTEATDSLTLSSSSGDLDVDDAPRGLDARTVSGDVQVRSAAGRVQARTSSGGIRMRLRGPLDAADLQSVSGEIRVDLAGGMDATLSLHSTSGSLSAAIPLAQLTTGRNELTGRFGRGGPPIRMRTASGSIHVTSGGK